MVIERTDVREVINGLDISGGGHSRMATKITYWVTTGLLAGMSAFAGFTYLSGSPQTVQEFAHVGYPQQLRIILGIAKLLGAIVLVVPGLAKLKEWAYAGFRFAWISAFCPLLYWGVDDGKSEPIVLKDEKGISRPGQPRISRDEVL